MLRFDAIIVGGGPAGSATAIGLARRGRTALLVESSAYEAWRAGETLPPEVKLILNELGVWQRFRQMPEVPSQGIVSAWGSDDPYDNHFLFNPHGIGWHVDRARFDRMLAAAAEEQGVCVWREARARSASFSGARWIVEIGRASGIETTETAYVVDATGRAAWLARCQGSRRRTYDRTVGIIGILAPADSSAPLEPALYIEAAPDGWWYSAPLPRGTLVVAYITDADYLVGPRRIDWWKQKLELTTHTASRARGFQLSAGLRVRSAATSLLEPISGPGWVAVGDAAGVYDPLAAAGVAKALQSGLQVAAATDEYLSGNSAGVTEYASSVRQQFERYLEQRSHFYQREKRWPENAFWRRRQCAGPPHTGWVE